MKGKKVFQAFIHFGS